MKKRTADERINDLIRLQRSTGWNALIEYLKESISDLERQILTVDEKANDKAFTAHDLARIQRSNLIALMELPAKIIADTEGQVEDEDIV